MVKGQGHGQGMYPQTLPLRGQKEWREESYVEIKAAVISKDREGGANGGCPNDTEWRAMSVAG